MLTIDHNLSVLAGLGVGVWFKGQIWPLICFVNKVLLENLCSLVSVLSMPIFVLQRQN